MNCDADISQQTGIDAHVNAANAQLKTGGRVAGAIHRTTGPVRFVLFSDEAFAHYQRDLRKLINNLVNCL